MRNAADIRERPKDMVRLIMSNHRDGTLITTDIAITHLLYFDGEQEVLAPQWMQRGLLQKWIIEKGNRLYRTQLELVSWHEIYY